MNSEVAQIIGWSWIPGATSGGPYTADDLLAWLADGQSYMIYLSGDGDVVNVHPIWGIRDVYPETFEAPTLLEALEQAVQAAVKPF